MIFGLETSLQQVLVLASSFCFVFYFFPEDLVTLKNIYFHPLHMLLLYSSNSTVPGVPDLRVDLETHASITIIGTPTPNVFRGLQIQKLILHKILAHFTVIKELDTNLLKSVSLIVTRC